MDIAEAPAPQRRRPGGRRRREDAPPAEQHAASAPTEVDKASWIFVQL